MPQPSIADSPWLWFSLFLAVGLTALVATGGKFGNRQAGIERQGQARTALAQGLDIAEDESGRKRPSGETRYSTPGDTQIRLWPLAVTLGLLLTGSLAMLVREVFSYHDNAKGTKEPEG